MALKFLNKKGWHTGSLRNIENVWKAEQKHEAEEKKLEELKKQIQDEREAQEFRLLQEQAGLIPKQERLEFLYDSGLAVGKVSTDEYLLGKPVEPEKTPTEIEKSAAAPGALFVDEKPQSANDQWRKLHSDPLLLIRQQEQAALARIKNNPVKMEMIKKSIVEKISKKEKKQRHKEKKHKEKQRKRKHSSDSEESIDNQNLDNKGKDKADDVNDEKVKARKERRETKHSSHISRRESPRKMKESPKKRHDSPDSVVERRRDTYRAEYSTQISRHKSPRKRHDSPDSSGERRQDNYRAEHHPHVSRHESPRRRQDSPRKRHDSPDSVGERRRHTYRAERSPHVSRYENSRRQQDSPRKRHYGADSVGERRGDTSKADHSPYVSRHENPSKGQDSPRKRHDSPDSIGERRQDTYRRHSSPTRDQSASARRSSKEWELSKQDTVDSDEDRSNHVNSLSPRRGSRRHDSRSPDGFDSHGMQQSFQKHDVAKANDIQYRRHRKSRSPRRSSRSPKRRDDYSYRQGDSPKRGSRRWDSKSPPRVRHDRRYDSPDSSNVGKQRMKSREKKEISIDKKVEVAVKNEEKCIGLDNMEGNRQRYKHKVGKLSEEEKAERLRAMQIDAEVHEEQRWHRLKKASDADKLEEARGTVNGNNFLDVTARNIYGAAAEGNIASVEESVRRRTHFIKRSIGDSNENTFQRS